MALIYAIIILTITWYSWLLYKHFNRPKHPTPPGPRGLPVVGSLPYLDPELHSYFARLARTYGPIMSLNLGTKKAIVISSPALAREILKVHDVTFANRDALCVNTAMEYNGHDIVFTPYGPEWKMLRKVCSQDMLGRATLDAFYSYRRQEVRSTVKYFYSLTGSPVNVGEQLFLTMLNVVTNMLWGGSIKGDERASIGAEFRQVVTEITELLGKPNVSDFFPSLAWLDLQAVVKEILRLHPVLPLMVPHCPSKPCVIGGYTVPKGARVFVNVWAIHRDASIWERPSEFIPERFLDGNKGDYSGNDFSYIPFGSGRRICAGIPMAERVVMFSLASLLHSFDWKLTEGDSLDLSEKFGIVLKKKVPLIAIPIPRLLGAAVYE